MGDDLRPKASAVGDLATEALHLAESDPHRALVLAQQVEDWPDQDDVGLRVLALAEWAKGRASRHLGLHREAEVALEVAVGLFASAGDQPALARALIALAQERIDVGRFDEAIAVLDEAESGVTGADKALVAAQRALALQRAGRVIDARDDFDRAVNAFESAGLSMPIAVNWTRPTRTLRRQRRSSPVTLSPSGVPRWSTTRALWPPAAGTCRVHCRCSTKRSGVPRSWGHCAPRCSWTASKSAFRRA